MINKKFEKAKDFEPPKNYNINLEEMFKLYEMSETDMFNTIYTAYKYGFMRGMAYNSKNKQAKSK